MTNQQAKPHPLNRHVVIGDNLEVLTAMGNETVDLIVTDPPFAKNYDFTGNLKPPLSPEEMALEKQTLADWGSPAGPRRRRRGWNGRWTTERPPPGSPTSGNGRRMSARSGWIRSRSSTRRRPR